MTLSSAILLAAITIPSSPPENYDRYVAVGAGIYFDLVHVSYGTWIHDDLSFDIGLHGHYLGRSYTSWVGARAAGTYRLFGSGAHGLVLSVGGGLLLIMPDEGRGEPIHFTGHALAGYELRWSRLLLRLQAGGEAALNTKGSDHFAAPAARVTVGYRF